MSYFRRISTVVTLLILAVVIAGCTRFVDIFPGSSAPGHETGPAVSHDGSQVTDAASLVDHLRAAGATVEPAGEVNQVFLTVNGQVITVNGTDVQVFEYADEASAAQEAAQIAPDGSSAGTTMITWIATPHFYRAGRLIVLYVGDDAAVTGLLQDALGEQFAGR